MKIAKTIIPTEQIHDLITRLARAMEAQLGDEVHMIQIHFCTHTIITENHAEKDLAH